MTSSVWSGIPLLHTLPVARPEKFLWQNKEGTKHHRTCTQAWMYRHEPVASFSGGAVTAVPSMHRWLEIVGPTFHHLYNVTGLIWPLALGPAIIVRLNTSVVTRSQIKTGFNCNQHCIICNAEEAEAESNIVTGASLWHHYSQHLKPNCWEM